MRKYQEIGNVKYELDVIKKVLREMFELLGK
jgi:hypothetical protein